ncbi:hypothetical protein [Sandarakinorhabdus sp. AAP62]|jgi:hypothetical protein|uniref:PepSY domain-containing protein n=1 Tax=Sandarakinorhabdus sp. AAP62 TaxID=1248916 RepID=UPI0012677621|nr:hypothetical protein [Sandarakinorhabdus sp. AAP62]
MTAEVEAVSARSNDEAMRVRNHLFFCVALVLMAPAAAVAGPNDVQEMVRAGEIMPLESIQRRVVQQNRGEYVGVQFDQNSRTYRFRFVRDGALVNVDVDARTGDPVRRRQSY